MLVNQLPEFGELRGVELAPFDEVGGEAVGGAGEEAVDEGANHAGFGALLRGDGAPGGAAAAAGAFYQAFVAHDAEHRGDGGGGDFTLGAEGFAEAAERTGTLAPECLQDFELDVGGLGAGRARHGGSPEAISRGRRVGANSNELELSESMEFGRIFVGSGEWGVGRTRPASELAAENSGTKTSPRMTRMGTNEDSTG